MRSGGVRLGSGQCLAWRSRVTRTVVAVTITTLVGVLPAAGVAVAASSAGKTVELTALVVASSDRQTKAYEAAFKLYEEAHPGVKITTTPIADPLIWQDKVLTMTVGGTPPDIMWLWGINFRNLASTGLLMPLDKYVTADFLKDYYPNAVEASRYEGTLYALPGLVGTLAILENMDIFDERGVAPLARKDTWEDFLAKAQKLTFDRNADGNVDVFGFVWYSFTIRDWMPWIWRNGGDLFDKTRKRFTLGEEPAVHAIQFLAELTNRYKVTPPGSVLYGSPWTYFEDGKAAMYPSGPWSLERGRKFTVDAGPYPIRKNEAVSLDVFYMGVHANTRYPDLAADVVKWVTHTFEGEGALFSSGFGIPAIREYALKYFVNPRTPVQEEVFLFPLEAGDARMLPYVDNWSQIEATLRNAYLPVWQGKDSPENVARAIKSKIESALK
ncbi:MAG: sugar ABC transporter substrate-binding protein [Limnochordales bacterium]|nr:sugar ABC transporter substrate-binding protein [Limnochordales bacterium]